MKLIGWGVGLLVSALAVGAGMPTPAEVQVKAAQVMLEEGKKPLAARLELASALIRRGRETGDGKWFDEALAALVPVLEKSPDQFEALKLKATILFSQRRYQESLELARSLSQRVPDDIPAYGLVADAARAVGLYEEADKAAQWMFDMRPPGALAYARGADLREAYGDFSGAADFAVMALRQMAPGDIDLRADWLTRLARLEREQGRFTFAVSYLQQAEKVFPEFPATLNERAYFHAAQGQWAEAVKALETLYAKTGEDGLLYRIGVVEAHAEPAKAAGTWARFVRAADAQTNEAVNLNKELAWYWLHEGKDARKALVVATKAAKQSRDVQTLAVLAMAQQKAGQMAAARKTLAPAIALGSKDGWVVAARAAVGQSATVESAAAHTRE